MIYQGGTRRSGKGAVDRTLLTVVLLVTGLGLVMVYSASSSLAAAAQGDAAFYLKRHLVRVVMGLFLLWVFANARYTRVVRLGRPLLIVSLVALVLVLLPSLGGVSAKGAHRWLAVGPLTFQPSDLARFALLLWLAETLTEREAVLGSFKEGFLPIVGPIAAVVALVLLEPDFSTAIVLTAICVAVLFVGGVRIHHLAGPALAALPAAYLFLMGSDYRRARIMAYLNGTGDVQGANYQVWQSLVGLGSGGLLGRGLGNSAQKLRFLPEPFNDFIFSIIGEELGFVGAVALLFLFGVLVLRGLRIARHAPDRIGSLLATGISFSIGIYVLINVGVVTSTLPATGLALPFISYGGTSLFFTLAATGILLSISRQVDLEDPAPDPGGEA